MRIGVLTFHSQLNYGGVLQCWALVEALRGLGHEVRVVDRWLDPTNSVLVGPFGTVGLRDWEYIVRHGLAGCGWLTVLLRRLRTMRFVRSVGLTPYHFHTWDEAPADLGVDCLVVGSDQVWNGADWNDVGVYLLEGAPKCPAVAYAASFGMRSLPPGAGYAEGFRRFSAIAVREREGVALVAGTGYPHPVEHVADPTLLLTADAWERPARSRGRRKRMVCYFLSGDVDATVRTLEPAVRDGRWEIVVLCNPRRMLPMPDSGLKILRQMIRRFGEIFGRSRVKVATWYGPREFVRAFARADACITDSFHAVMLSSVYGVNVRFLRPDSAVRKDMFARIEEFADAYVKGEMFVPDVAAALASLESGTRTGFDREAMAAFREKSLNWLKASLEEVAASVCRKPEGGGR